MVKHYFFKLTFIFYCTLLFCNTIYAKEIDLDGRWEHNIKSNYPISASIDNNIIVISNISCKTYVLDIKVIKNNTPIQQQKNIINSNGNIYFYLNELDKSIQYKLEITTEEGNFLYGYFYF